MRKNRGRFDVMEVASHIMDPVRSIVAKEGQRKNWLLQVRRPSAKTLRSALVSLPALTKSNTLLLGPQNVCAATHGIHGYADAKLSGEKAGEMLSITYARTAKNKRCARC